MYLILSDMLISHEYFTHVEFIKSSTLLIHKNINDRKIVVNYPEGTSNSILSGVFTILNEKILNIEGLFQLNTDNTVINGIRYYNLNYEEKVVVNQLLVSTELISNKTYRIDSNNLYLLIPEDQLSSINITEYVEFVNSSNKVYAEIYDESDFKISNISNVILNSVIKLNLTSTRVYSLTENYLNFPMIISSFITRLKSLYEKILFTTNIDHNTDKNFRFPICIYTTNLSKAIDSYTTRVHYHPDYEKFKLDQCTISFEYITDNISEYINVIDKYKYGTWINKLTTTKVNDNSGEEWSITINWDYSPVSEDQLDRVPTSELFSDMSVYSFKFSCNILGFILMSYQEHSRIKNIIIRN